MYNRPVKLPCRLSSGQRRSSHRAAPSSKRRRHVCRRGPRICTPTLRRSVGISRTERPREVETGSDGSATCPLVHTWTLGSNRDAKWGCAWRSPIFVLAMELPYWVCARGLSARASSLAQLTPWIDGDYTTALRGLFELGSGSPMNKALGLELFNEKKKSSADQTVACATTPGINTRVCDYSRISCLLVRQAGENGTCGL